MKRNLAFKHVMIAHAKKLKYKLDKARSIQKNGKILDDKRHPKETVTKATKEQP